MGSSYIGNADHHHSLKENIPTLDKFFVRSFNHYGTSHNKSTKVFEIQSKNQFKTAETFFNLIAYGGILERELKIGTITTGKIALMADGTRIVYRTITSSTDSPAIEINVDGSREKGPLKNHKIHFVKS